MKRMICAAALLLTACAAYEEIPEETTVSVMTTAATTVTTTTPAVTTTEETTPTYVTIYDDSGEFAYAGELREIGDADSGYIMVPSDFVRVRNGDILQYCDPTGNNIVTLDHYDDIDYETAAQNVSSFLASNKELSGVSAAVLTVGGYDCIQLHGSYEDGVFAVIWVISDPSDETSCYYLSFEFDPEHQYLMACSSTFMTVHDHDGAESMTDVTEEVNTV